MKLGLDKTTRVDLIRAALEKVDLAEDAVRVAMMEKQEADRDLVKVLLDEGQIDCLTVNKTRVRRLVFLHKED